MATNKKSSGSKTSSQGASKEIREEMHEAKAGRVKNEKQAIAIGLSRARRAGKDVPPPKKGTTSPATRKKALQDIAAGKARKSASKKSAANRKTTKRTVAKKATGKKATGKKATKRR